MQARSGTSILYGRCILHGFLVNKIFRFPVQMLCDICKTRGALTVHISAQDPVQLALSSCCHSHYTPRSLTVSVGVPFFLKGSL
jgi:hypothetical protein